MMPSFSALIPVAGWTTGKEQYLACIKYCHNIIEKFTFWDLLNLEYIWVG